MSKFVQNITFRWKRHSRSLSYRFLSAGKHLPTYTAGMQLWQFQKSISIWNQWWRWPAFFYSSSSYYRSSYDSILYSAPTTNTVHQVRTSLRIGNCLWRDLSATIIFAVEDSMLDDAARFISETLDRFDMDLKSCTQKAVCWTMNKVTRKMKEGKANEPEKLLDAIRK